jgi:hypothetical protein
LQQLVRWIEHLDWTVTILIDVTGEVIAGYGRLSGPL